jgi:hypothetical protein
LPEYAKLLGSAPGFLPPRSVPQDDKPLLTCRSRCRETEGRHRQAGPFTHERQDIYAARLLVIPDDQRQDDPSGDTHSHLSEPAGAQQVSRQHIVLDVERLAFLLPCADLFSPEP